MIREPWSLPYGSLRDFREYVEGGLHRAREGVIRVGIVRCPDHALVAVSLQHVGRVLVIGIHGDEALSLEILRGLQLDLSQMPP